jgi:biopolymer transport protein ExbD
MQVIGRGARIVRHHKRHEAAEINLTSMIDMMTILVFFLLVHGGFVRLEELPFKLLKKVMATSTAASYGAPSLAVLQKASDLAFVASND